MIILSSGMFCLILLLLLCGILLPTTNGAIVNTAGMVTFFDMTNIGFTGAGDAYSQLAQIVYSSEDSDSLRLPPYHRLVVNLMLPPKEYADLCHYPLPLSNDEDETASIGDDNDPNVTTAMPSADDSNLQSLLNDADLPIEFEFSPIAFLVPLQREPAGSTNTTATSSPTTDCDILTKIKVALQYQQNVFYNQQLWSIIFYNNHADEEEQQQDDNKPTQPHGYRDDGYDPDSRVFPMGIPADSDSNDIPGLDTLILATVSHSTGTRIKEQMERAIDVQYSEEVQQSLMEESYNATTTTKPTFAPYYLFHKGNLDWQYPVSLERGANVPFHGSNSQMDEESNNSNWGTYTFIWFRFILFAFIFCFPFMRCLRLWWAAGGRIRFRRNERGWITGLAYQPAMDNWYNIMTATGTNHRNQRESSKRHKLTKEQVLALPEIEYDGQPEGSENADDYGNEDRNEDLVDVDLGTSDNAKDSIKTESRREEEHAPPDRTTSNPDEDVAEGLEHNRECACDADKEKPCFTTTISTMCSICIEEFEFGEKVRLLPRCGHGFHTDCILPWLTERQGYCPFCKTNVVVSQEDEKEGDDDEENRVVAEGQSHQEEQDADVESQQRVEQSRDGA